MKMSRQDLKNLVKECLVEILSEGLVGTAQSINENRRQAPVQNQQITPVNRKSLIADKISFLPTKSEIKQAQSPAPPSHRALANSLTSDPVLADIFADTARTGMHKKMNESSGGANHEQMVASSGDAAARAMLQSDPIDIFGDSAGKWAALAFSEKMPARS